MTKLQTLQSELLRLNVEILTDTGVTYRNKLKRISVITNTIAREVGNTGGGQTGLNGTSFITGTGVPSSVLGSNGDTYLDSSTGNLYVKANGIW